jgi:hypothetical protein
VWIFGRRMRRELSRFSAYRAFRGAFRGPGRRHWGRLDAMGQGRYDAVKCLNRSNGEVSRQKGKRTSTSRAAMYFTSPNSVILRFTSSVNATGEKTARAPDWRRTANLESAGYAGREL